MIAPQHIHTVSGWQDIPLHVPEFGDPDGPAIVLVHGWSQSHLSWERQLDGPLADRFRLIAPDLRGHGQSGKPDAPENYNHSAPWAGDINAIIKQLGLVRPILVGWSMGGWVVQDYLRMHGDADIAGFSLVGSSGSTGRHTPVEALEKRTGDSAVSAKGMFESDLPTNIAATIAFVKACFATPLAADDLATMVAFNMLCPPHVRRAARIRHEDYTDTLAKTRVPALVQWGVHERLAVAPMPQHTVDVLPKGRAICYAHSGHAPFWEEAEQFNADLADFANSCAGKDTAI